MNEPNAVDSPDIFWGEGGAVVSRHKKRTGIDFSEYKSNKKYKKKKCQLCGESFRPNTGRAKYCSRSCRRIAQRNSERKFALKKNGKIGHIIGDVGLCPVCGDGFVIRSGTQKYCKNCQGKVAAGWRNGSEAQLGAYIDCLICGKTIKRTGTHRMWCPEKCQPPPGDKIKCTSCGEPKGYLDFYDYRDNIDGKFIRRCKKCTGSKQLRDTTRRRNENGKESKLH